MAKTGLVQLMLAKTLCDKGWPVGPSLACAKDCVKAGYVTDFWRKKLGDDAADGLNEDLERLKDE